jgi:hypothetical protein
MSVELGPGSRPPALSTNHARQGSRISRQMRHRHRHHQVRWPTPNVHKEVPPLPFPRRPVPRRRYRSTSSTNHHGAGPCFLRVELVHPQHDRGGQRLLWSSRCQCHRLFPDCGRSSRYLGRLRRRKWPLLLRFLLDASAGGKPGCRLHLCGYDVASKHPPGRFAVFPLGGLH